MNATFTEYRNQNTQRKYPFLDDASLLATNNVRLPTDWLLDAFLYVIDAVGPIYLSHLDLSEFTAEFTDSGTRKVVAIATWAAGDTSAGVFDVTPFKREAGILVFGGSTDSAIAEGNVLDFLPVATTLTPTCCVPLVQAGVRGIISNDDGQLTTGDVVLRGEGGIQVTTLISDGRKIVRVDLLGDHGPTPQECDGAPPIRKVRIINEECTPLVAGGTDGVIRISAADGFELDSMCPQPRIPDPEGQLPGEVDICEDPIPPPSHFVCPPFSTTEIDVVDGQLFILAPPPLGHSNVVRVKTDTTPGAAVSAAGMRTENLSAEEISRRLTEIGQKASQPSGRVSIHLRGPVR